MILKKVQNRNIQKQKYKSMKETGVISEKEPFIQHCFYSNVFKGESKEKIDYQLNVTGEAMRITCTRFFFFFNFHIFFQQQIFRMEMSTR